MSQVGFVVKYFVIRKNNNSYNFITYKDNIHIGNIYQPSRCLKHMYKDHI